MLVGGKAFCSSKCIGKEYIDLYETPIKEDMRKHVTYTSDILP
jgi:hypothetical protein